MVPMFGTFQNFNSQRGSLELESTESGDDIDTEAGEDDGEA
jgi:hypothetical protein